MTNTDHRIPITDYLITKLCLFLMLKKVLYE